MLRVGVNGFGRIGRAFLRASLGDRETEVVAVNDLGDVKIMAYLLSHDTVYHALEASVAVQDGALVVGGRRIAFVGEREPANIPWGELGVDIVVEATGLFTDYEKASAHLSGGAKKVVISAPAHGEHDAGEHPLGATVLAGINEEKLSVATVTSNASCTTNAASPVIAILSEALGIEKALLNTTHAYTASQRIVDGPSGKDLREGRAGAQNIIPSSTGAAIAVTKALPALADKFDGIALRVPVACGSIADITFVSGRDTSAEEVNKLLTDAARQERWHGIFAVSDEPLVSSDIIGMPEASIADLSLTRVVDGNLCKVLAWYDNEMGYAHTLLRHVKAAGKHLS